MHTSFYTSCSRSFIHWSLILVFFHMLIGVVYPTYVNAAIAQSGNTFLTSMGDYDNDGYKDYEDRCPTVANANNAFTGVANCVDNDKDGYEDSLSDVCADALGEYLGCSSENELGTYIAPSCTVPSLVKSGDRLMIQIKGTSYVSDPITVD